MATAMRVFRKFRASDGRIKIATSGVLALVAALTLLVVLPASATHVEPVLSEGNPSCSDLLAEDDYLFEHKIDNPTSTDEPIKLEFEDLSGSLEIEVFKVQGEEKFDFSFRGDFDAAAVIVKGGSAANFYDYRPSGETEDEGLHAPENPKNGKLHDLSHISFCVGEAPNFFCDTPVTLTDEEGPIVEVTAAIFANSLHDCFDKEATFTNDGEQVTLAFDGDPDTNLTAAGRLDFTKEFDTPPDFESLEYDGPGEFVDLQWCDVRDKQNDDGAEFDDVLASDEYPSLDGVTDAVQGDPAATACKVYEEEDASGTQYTVVYFEFEDPQFR